MTTPIRRRASDFFSTLQSEICDALELADGSGRFREDQWDREGGGGGRSKVMESGALFEKAGVNSSEVHGELQPAFASRMPVGDGTAFFAAGVSLVLHPLNPMVPTVHANFRYLERGSGGWFGGGTDLTPYYPYLEDAVHFHRTLKGACDRFDPDYYPRFKKWCDEYFFVKHRNESRGIGGIFFDYLTGSGSKDQAANGESKIEPEYRSTPHISTTAETEGESGNGSNQNGIERIFEFVQAAGRAFLPAYLPIVERRRVELYGDRERQHQLVRRGRYVEFNLVYDRGTIFGLETKGRTESILMSLPPMVRWVYDYRPEPGSREETALDFYRPRDWLAEPGK